MAQASVSRLVVARDEKLRSIDAKVDRKILDGVLGEGMAKLAGTSEADAWSRFFQPNDIVGLKVNTAFGQSIAVHLDLIWTIIDGLKTAGVKEDNIYVWDWNDVSLTRAAYPLNDGGGVKFVSAERDGYADPPISQGVFNGRLCRILAETITALINVPILKDHRLSGVTIGMKNHYGSIDNPREHHDNTCDPAIADLNCVPAIRDKTRLIVCDAVRPLAEGGPRDNDAYRWDYGGLLLSSDPVALDYWGWRIIEERRRIIGVQALANIGREPTWIASASDRGLGTNDPSRIEVLG